MGNLSGWQPPALFEQVTAAGIIAADACVIIWNPCDGYHLYRLIEREPAKIMADFRAGFGTHWRTMVDGPDVAPFAWFSMDTLEDAYEDDRISLDSPILWSPTGAHRIPWLSFDRPWALAEQGRQGLYTAWCQPPLRPAE